MNMIKKLAPWILVLMLVVFAYFIFAKSKLKKALEKTDLTDSQQEDVIQASKEAKSTYVSDTSTTVDIVLTFPDAATSDKYKGKLKFAGFDLAEPDNPLKYVAILTKKK